MTNPLYTISTLPADDQAALREFNDRYVAAISAAPPPSWADLGDMFPTSSPMVTFPVSNLALKYQQTEGESRFKTFLSKSLDLKVQEYDAGIEGRLLDITTQIFAYKAWQEGPSRMLMAKARHRNKAIAALLESGHSDLWGTSPGIDGVNFFSASHLSDLGDPASTTWSNYQSSGKDVVSIPNIQAEVALMQAVRDENGDKLGVDPDTILVPTEKYEAVRNLLAQNLFLAGGTSTSVTSAATSNPYMGRFNVVHVPEFTDANDWYLVDSKLLKMGMAPWVSLEYTTPDPTLQLRQWDQSSDFFKDTGRIKVSSHMWTAHALCMPHVIRKVTGA